MVKRLQCDEARDLSNEIAAWAEAKWPHGTTSTKFRKLCEEVGELGEAMMGGDDVEVIHEAADCMICLAHILQMQGLPDFVDAMNFVFRERAKREGS